MKVKMKTDTTFVISGIPREGHSWETLSYLEKALNKHKVKKVSHSEKGFDITFNRYFNPDAFLTMKNIIEEEIKRGVEYAIEQNENTENEYRKFNKEFKFRNLGKRPKGKRAAAAWDDVSELQEAAKENVAAVLKTRSIDLDEDHYFCIFDFPAYYKVLDAAKKGDDRKARDILGNQDTSVRGRFDNLYNYFEDKGIY